MTTRTSTKTVTFKQPFSLRGLDRSLPAGDYTVETDEELVLGLTFPVYRKVLTQIRLRTVPGHPGRTQVLKIDQHDLENALAWEKTNTFATEGWKPGHE